MSTTKTPLTATAVATPASKPAYWLAVQQRDKSFDGQFVFAVTTTGIYCRPSCPARTAKPEHVQFFADTATAENAGFRACKRCKPNGLAQNQAQQILVEKICGVIKTHVDEKSGALALHDLAEQAGLSPSHFHRLFKNMTGLTPKAYQKALTKAKLVRHLEETSSVTNAIYDAGFSSSSRFYEGANAMLGMKPKQLQKKGQGTIIHYAVHDCALGQVIIAATQRGICAIEFGDKADELIASLRERFSHATLMVAKEAMQTHVEQVLRAISQPYSLANLPLDVQGTVFQQRVWQALRSIPPGQTLSYTALAEKIGQPRAVRAVASACAANQIALAIPCHRIVRTDGSLSGYRWGVERKAALLQLEKEL